MPTLDLTEIPSPRDGMKGFDAFELFAREFLEFLGFKVISQPARGPDGGKDLVVKEVRSGAGGSTTLKWLVSCKHFAHSGKAVGVTDEDSILDRVRAASCDGFLGVYSTVPSSSLGARLEALRSECEVLWFDPEGIENQLLQSSAGMNVAARFFPDSFSRHRQENPVPAKLFSDQDSLKCEYCSVDLLNPPSGIVTVWKQMRDPEDNGGRYRFLDIYWCCKGNCDRALGAVYRARYSGKRVADGWEDIPDLCIPQLYLRWLLTTINGMHQGDAHTDEALEKEKRFIIHLAPHVLRDLTSKEWETLDRLGQIPDWLGGLG